MAPSADTDMYRLYKEGTTKLTGWLVGNALRCKANIQLTPQSKSKYQVPLSQFKIMATTIVQSTEPVIRISPKILALIRHTINLRKRATDFFVRMSASTSMAKHHESNACHLHFIGILEEVLTILDPCQQAGQNEENPELLSNAFSVLQVESDADEGANAATPSTKNAKTKATYVPEADQSDDAFAIYAFFQDITDIREYIQSVWVDYINGKLDVMSAAVTTDTAIHSIRLMCEALAQAPSFVAMKQLTGFNAIDYDGNPDYACAITYLLKYLGYGLETPESLERWVCVRAANMLKSFASVLNKRSVPYLDPQFYGVYQPEKDRSSMSKEQRDEEDLFVTMNLLPEFVKLSHCSVEVPVEDEVTTGIRALTDTCDAKQLPMYAIFGLQILLDIHNSLRQHVVQPFDELQATSRRAVATINSFFKLLQNQDVEQWTPENNDIFVEIRELAESWGLDDLMAGMMKLPTPADAPNTQDFYLLRNHPILCGLLIFRLNLLLQEAGIHLCNAWGSVIYSAHLYNACRQSAALDWDWEDIDFVIATHSASRLFVGAPPCDVDAYMRRYMLALGRSATMFARNRRPGTQVFSTRSKKGPRRLKTTTPVRDTFEPRYAKQQNAALTRGNMVAMLAVALKAERTSPVSVDLQKFCAHVSAKPVLTQIEVLQVVREGLAGEELHLLFDYIGLHFRAIKLLSTLKTHVDDQMSKFYGPTWIQRDFELPYVVGYIFDFIFGKERSLQQQYGGSNVLHVAANTIRTFLKQGGGGKSHMRAKALSNSRAHQFRTGVFDDTET